MERMMARMMGKENMPKMMEAMMAEVFGAMKPEERMEFVRQMIPICIGRIFENLDGEERVKTALGILEKLKDELERQAKGGG